LAGIGKVKIDGGVRNVKGENVFKKNRWEKMVRVVEAAA